MTRMAIAATWVWVALVQPVSALAPEVPDSATRFVAAMCTCDAASLVVDNAPPLEDAHPAWCLTPDDPRCSPLEESSLPTPRWAQAPLSAVSSLALSDFRGHEPAVFLRALQLGAARAGCQHRLERPPRSR